MLLHLALQSKDSATSEMQEQVAQHEADSNSYDDDGDEEDEEDDYLEDV